MLTQEGLFMIHDLRRQGLSVRAIASRTGLSRKTVRKYLRTGLEPPHYGPRASRASELAPHVEYVRQRLKAFPELTAQRLLREIRERGFRGGYTILKELVREHRPAREKGFEHRFETEPGEQAQVDFAHFKVTFTDEPSQVHVVWLFSMVLGFSRALFGRFVLRQNLHTFLRAHLQGFAAFGGVPREVLYDRLKAAVVGVDPQGRPLFNPALLDLAAHFGFQPRACRPYRAKTKGKIERPNRYIRQDFFLGREFRNFEDLNTQYADWLLQVANRRVHGTTHRVVEEALVEERGHLLPLPEVSYRSVLHLERRLTRDGMVSVDGNAYSVPDTTRQRAVEVHSLADEIRIYDGGHLVAIHEVLEGRGQSRVLAGHRRYPPPGNAKIRREEVAEAWRETPGGQVAIRPLEVYQRIGTVLATTGRARS